MIYSLDGHRPVIDKTCFIASNASVMGRVSIAKHASVWFNVVVRGDVEDITIGARSNIQDGSVLHADPGSPLVIGQDVTVGHMCMLHGCTVGDGSLIGIGTVVLNGARIGNNCLIAARCLVTENMIVPDGAVVMGSPGRVVRTLDEAQQAALRLNAARYMENATRFSTRLRPLDR